VEYVSIVASVCHATVTRASINDAIAATKEGGTMPADIFLSQASNTMAAIEDLDRDIILFLDLTSDLNASAYERDYGNDILCIEFLPGV
jgi:hypothetical protein